MNELIFSGSAFFRDLEVYYDLTAQEFLCIHFVSARHMHTIFKSFLLLFFFV